MMNTPQYHSKAKAVHGIQLYILCSFIYVVTLCKVSFGVEQVDRSVMHLFLEKISVNFFIILLLCCCCCCCCCVLLNNIHMLLLLLLCITQQQQWQIQDSNKLIMRSLLSNIQRPIVKQISFTATCSRMPYIYFLHVVQWQISIYGLKIYCEANNLYCYMLWKCSSIYIYSIMHIYLEELD